MATKNEAIRVARLKVENETGEILIPISSNKPDIPDQIQRRWQRIVDICARIMDAPSGLITHLTSENLEIFVASMTKGNPYKKDDHDLLGIGMFCETVAGRRRPMTVQDINDSEYWKGNPHASFGMQSYMGVPIQWSDGEIFGTMCILNDRTHTFTDEFKSLLFEFKEIIETDLENVLLNEELKKKISAHELQMRELHHRIKNQFNMLLGMISLHEIAAEEDISSLLNDLQNKIRTLSLLHEKLHMKATDELLDLRSYLNDLYELIIKDFLDLKVVLSTDIDDVTLTLETALPLGLIFTELLSNSIKYAFGRERENTLSLRIKKDGQSRLSIEYYDNGSGYPGNIEELSSSSLGLSLVRMMTEQLGGKMQLSTDAKGAIFRAVINQPE